MKSEKDEERESERVAHFYPSFFRLAIFCGLHLFDGGFFAVFQVFPHRTPRTWEREAPTSRHVREPVYRLAAVSSFFSSARIRSRWAPTPRLTLRNRSFCENRRTFGWIACCPFALTCWSAAERRISRRVIFPNSTTSQDRLHKLPQKFNTFSQESSGFSRLPKSRDKFA